MPVDFYHLAATPLERVLPRLCERVLADGGRMLVVADEEALLAKLDRMLWDYSPAGFLPHAREGAHDDARQPVLLTSGLVAVNGARTIALADGRWRDAALGFDRALYLFDADHLEEARASWRALAGRSEVERRYWRQDEAGKWLQGP